ncbi:hypothetical protein [Streptomyces sp. TR06-5]|uniref:hypothetical protein n=1 Tax=Streptomyces sp. TR06-5 TaxID=3385976 RepID=UPI00399F8F8B
MPLNFLTTDHAPVEHVLGPDRALPFEGRTDRRRPYRIGPWRVAASAVLLLLTSYVLISSLVLALTGQASGALVFVGVAVVTAALALRLLRVGVWVSRDGLRQVALFHTVTLRWSDVGAVRTRQQPVKWLGLPRTVQGQALEIVRSGGGAPLRYVLTTHNADFLNRPEAFDRAADVIEGWAAEARAHGQASRQD